MSYPMLGSKIGPRIAALVSRAIIATHNGLHAAKHKLAMAVFRSISDEISEEVDTALGPIFKALVERDDIPDELRPHLEFMAYGHGQLKALVGSSLSGAGLLQPLATVITNLLNPSVMSVVSATPNAVPDPGTIARIFASGADSYDGTAWAMRGQGLNDSWIRDIYEAALQYPDTQSTLELYQRGEIGSETALLNLRRSGMPTDRASEVLRLAKTLLSPAELALAVLRGNMSMGEGERQAAKSGVDSADFNVMVNNTGEPVALMQLLEAYRRGFIDEGRLVRGIEQSRIRNEWVDVALKLRYAPMSVADAVNAVVQNHLSHSQGDAISQQNGLEPGSFNTLVETAGEPLSRTEMEQLYNRGLVSQAEVEQALRESRLKNKYIGHAFQLHQKVIPVFVLQRALKYGGISHDQALRVIKENGYSGPDAEIILKASSNERMQTFRDKVVHAIETLYEDSGISRDRAEAAIHHMGYSAEESTTIMEAAEYRRKSKITNAVISNLRSRYVARHIDAEEAQHRIDEIGVPATQRDQLLVSWDIERSASVRVLTPAQILKAVKLQLINEVEGAARLLQAGYSSEDAALLLAGA